MGLFSKVKETKVSTGSKRTNISVKCGSFLAVVDRGKLGRGDDGEGAAFIVLETTVISLLGETNAILGESLQEYNEKGKYKYFEEHAKKYSAFYAGVDPNNDDEKDEEGNELTDEWWEDQITKVFGTFDDEGKPVVDEDTNQLKGAVLHFNCVPKMDKKTSEQQIDKKGNKMHYVNCHGIVPPGDDMITEEILEKYGEKLCPRYAEALES